MIVGLSNRLTFIFSFSRITYRFAILFGLFGLASLGVFAQSCPTQVGPYELQHTFPDGNAFRCRNSVNTSGNTICSLSCTYKRPETREVNSFSVYFEYASKVQSAISVGSNHMCTSTSEPSRRNSPNAQVYALREYIDNPLETIQSDHVISRVFRQIEPMAARCPGVAVSPPPTTPIGVCPNRFGTFYRWNPNQVFGVSMDEPSCELDRYGNRVCRVDCDYRDSDATGANQFKLTPWWTEVYGQRELAARGMCTISPSPGYWGHIAKQALVAYEGPTLPWIRKNAETLANMALDTIAGRSADCPAPSSPTPSCAASFENYQNAKLRSHIIDRELDVLKNHDTALARARSDLAKWNEVIRGIADPNYNGAQKELVRQLLHLSPDLRNRLRSAYGLREDADAPTIARTMRDMEAAKVDYFLNAARTIRALEDEKLDVDIKLSAARNEIRKGGCGGNLEAKSCELTGEWELFNAQESMGIWKFSASGPNAYTAKNSLWDLSARAEIIGRNAVLVFSDPDFAGRTQLKFDEGCRRGEGKFQFNGTNREREMMAHKRDGRQPIFIDGSMYGINFEGRFYQTTFSRQSQNGRPIDVFYFKILMRDGSQPEIRNASGVIEKLTGRFVREPSFDHPDQSNVEWYFVDWVLTDGEWRQVHRRGTRFEVR